MVDRFGSIRTSYVPWPQGSWCTQRSTTLPTLPTLMHLYPSLAEGCHYFFGMGTCHTIRESSRVVIGGLGRTQRESWRDQSFGKSWLNEKQEMHIGSARMN